MAVRLGLGRRTVPTATHITERRFGQATTTAIKLKYTKGTQAVIHRQVIEPRTNTSRACRSVVAVSLALAREEIDWNATVLSRRGMAQPRQSQGRSYAIYFLGNRFTISPSTNPRHLLYLSWRDVVLIIRSEGRDRVHLTLSPDPSSDSTIVLGANRDMYQRRYLPRSVRRLVERELLPREQRRLLRYGSHQRPRYLWLL